MKVLILRSTVADGQDVEAGQVVEVAADTARYLKQLGKAIDAPAEEPKPKATRKAKADGAE